MSRSINRALCSLLVAAVWLTAADRARCEEVQPLPFVEGSTTLVVLPDTEVYTNKNPHLLQAQMQWINENRASRNIAYILHVGDVTNNNTDREWRVARECFDMLDGKVPYILAAGNHDYDHTPGRLTHMNKFFGVSDMKEWSTFGDVFEPGKLENQYRVMDIQGRKWLVLSLETGPRNAVIDWANKVLAQHKDRLAIILTHAYLYYGNQRYNHLEGSQRASPYGFYGEGADGEQLWNKLIRKHPNAMIVICGHLSSGYVGYRADEGDYGNVVHQMMCDYEKIKGGGLGFLRLLEFLPDGKTVQVRTYSPVTKGTNPRDPELEEFAFELKLADRDEPRPASTELDPPLKMPICRYSFDGTGSDGAKISDSIGDAHGLLRSETGRSMLDGKGRLVLAGNDGRDGYAQLPPRLLANLTDVSVEVWFTPTASQYNWNSVWRLGDGGGDFFWYTFRTLNVHRAEIGVSRDNEDIQRKDVPAAPGKRMHVVVTYDRDGAEGKPLLQYFRDGELTGRLNTSKLLSDVDDTQNRLGPIAGIYDELRIYDFPMGRAAVRRCFEAGHDRLPVAGPSRE